MVKLQLQYDLILLHSRTAAHGPYGMPSGWIEEVFQMQCFKQGWQTFVLWPPKLRQHGRGEGGSRAVAGDRHNKYQVTAMPAKIAGLTVLE